MTRTTYLAQLNAAYSASVKFGGNQAIKRHADKVAAMDEAQFQAHYAALNRTASSAPAQETFKRLAAEALAKGWR